MNSEKLGRTLREKRKKLGYSADKVGKLLGLTGQAILQYELNKRDIPSLTLSSIFRILKISGKELTDLMDSLDDIPSEEKTAFVLYHVDTNMKSFMDESRRILVTGLPQAVNATVLSEWDKAVNHLSELGYKIAFDEDNTSMWLSNGEFVFEVNENEILDLYKESASYLKYKIQELSEGRNKYPVKK